MPKQHRRDERLSRKQMLSQVSEVTLKRFAKKKACEDCTVCFKSAQKAVDEKAVGLVSTYAHGKGEEISVENFPAHTLREVLQCGVWALQEVLVELHLHSSQASSHLI